MRYKLTLETKRSCVTRHAATVAEATVGSEDGKIRIHTWYDEYDDLDHVTVTHSLANGTVIVLYRGPLHTHQHRPAKEDTYYAPPI
jgi:hypothetical protein